MKDDQVVQIVSMIVACVIVLGGMLIAILLGLRAANRRVARLEAQPPPPVMPFDPYRSPPGAAVSDPTANAAGYYCISIFFWPAAFVLGLHFLRDRTTARMGRTCLRLGMGVIGTVGLLTCLGMGTATILSARIRSAVYERPSAHSTSSPAAHPLPEVKAPEPLNVTGYLHEPTPILSEVVTVNDLELHFVPIKPAEPADPIAGMNYATFDVSIFNSSAKTLYNGSWRVFDAQGHAFLPVYSMKEPQFHAGAITPQSTLRGWVTFRLPHGSSASRLQYTSSGNFMAVVEFALPP